METVVTEKTRPAAVPFSDEHLLDISELEGFFSAIVISPGTLLPTVWIPEVLGGSNPGFKSVEAFAVTGGIG